MIVPRGDGSNDRISYECEWTEKCCSRIENRESPDGDPRKGYTVKVGYCCPETQNSETVCKDGFDANECNPATGDHEIAP